MLIASGRVFLTSLLAGALSLSVAAAPAVPRQPWFELRPGVPAGKVEELRLRSARLGNERVIRVYTPPGYDPRGAPHDLLIVLDGKTYTSDVPAPILLDNLVAAGRIPPPVAVFVANASPEARGLELSCHPPFADFLARELIPWVRHRYRVTTSPARTVIFGSSLGGLAAACAGLRHPGLFGNVLSLSGSFYWPATGDDEPEWLARQLASRPRLPLRFFLAAGRLEDRPHPRGPSLLAANRHLRDVLWTKGYAVDYREVDGGHSIESWRVSLADGLLSLLGPRAVHRHGPGSPAGGAARSRGSRSAARVRAAAARPRPGGAPAALP